MTAEQAVDKIFNDPNLATSTKVIRLYAITMMEYRQPSGDQAWKAIENLVGKEITFALAFCTGASMGSALTKGPNWNDLVPELAEEEPNAEEASNNT